MKRLSRTPSHDTVTERVFIGQEFAELLGGANGAGGNVDGGMGDDMSGGAGSHASSGGSLGSDGPCGSLLASDIGPEGLAGVVFVANNDTIGECFKRMLFGLPDSYLPQLKGIVPGYTRLFLFNLSTRYLAGIFVATEPAAMNIEPYAWTDVSRAGGAGVAEVNDQNKKRTKFGAQVRVRELRRYVSGEEKTHE